MAYRRRNPVRRRYARPSTKRGFKARRRLTSTRLAGLGPRPAPVLGSGGFRTRLGVVGRKRNAARAAVLQQRRVRRRGAGGGGEIGFVNRRGGTWKKWTIPKLLKVGFNRITYRFQGVQRQNASNGTFDPATQTTTLAPPGYFKLSNSIGGASGVYKYPLFAFDLTTVPNNGGTSNPVGYQLTNNGTLWTWTAQPAQIIDGTTQVSGNTWHAEDSLSPGVSTMSSRFIQTDWFDIRLLAYGALTQPTFYDVMVVSFTRGWLRPCAYADNSSAEEIDQGRAFWAGMTKNLVFNNIMPGQRNQFQGMRVHRRFRFVLQPTRADDNDRNPNMRVVKLFQKEYTVGDYSWGANSNPAELVVDSAQWNQSAPGTIRNHPRDVQQRFLIVRASNTTERDTESANDTPSFDIVMRKQVQVRTT